MRRDIKTGTDKHTFDKRGVVSDNNSLNKGLHDADDEKRIVESKPVEPPKPPIL